MTDGPLVCSSGACHVEGAVVAGLGAVEDKGASTCSRALRPFLRMLTRATTATTMTTTTTTTRMIPSSPGNPRNPVEFDTGVLAAMVMFTALLPTVVPF